MKAYSGMAKRFVTAALTIAFAFPSIANATERKPLDFNEKVIARVDGSDLTLLIAKPSAPDRVPLLLIIDGSLCIPSRLAGDADQLATINGRPYATLIVEKPDVTQPEIDANGEIRIGPEFNCSDGFRNRYTIDQRVLDHLRAIQHLRSHADWWNGELLIWGFSDGGRIASRVGAFSPETRGMVLGGFGGGRPMARDFEDFHVCHPDRTVQREECLSSLRHKFEEMRGNPSPLQTWNGNANSWAVWASRLDAVEANLLKDVTVPVLMFHGSDDTSTPVESARMLAERLQDVPTFVYREIEGMGHGLGSGAASARGEALRIEFITWLLGTLDSPTSPSSPSTSPRSK